jgi:hypothetical protein
MSSFAPSDWIECSRAAVSELKQIRNLMPASKDRDNIDERIKRAEDLLSRADAELAQKLGFYLCKCAFPPKIMLWVESRSAHVCQSCGHQQPIATKPVRLTRGRVNNDWDIFSGR